MDRRYRLIAALEIIPTAAVLNGVCYSGSELLVPTAHKARLVWNFLSFFCGLCHHAANCTGGESVPKIIPKWHDEFISFKLQSAFFLISNHDSFRVLFDKIASVYFIRELHLCFSIGNGQSREPALCQLYRHTLVAACYTVQGSRFPALSTRQLSYFQRPR